MSFLILAFFVWAGFADQIIAEPCPLTATKLQCVGADEDCHADVRSPKASPYSNFPTACPIGGTCKVCGDDSLVCSATKVCVRRSAGVGDSCSTTRFCLANLECVGSTCVDQSATWFPPGAFAQNGEPCNPANGNGDCLGGISGLVCNALTNKCDLPSVISSVRSCNDRSSCPAGQYCSIVNNFGGPTFERTCKPAIPLGSRAGALCVSGSSGQCGWTYSCEALNPSETTGPFARSICLEYYSLPAGRQATNDHFCKSGIRVGLFCVDPDYSTLGDACSPVLPSIECGADAVCGCPEEGGSRTRCIKSNTRLQNDIQKDEYFRQKPYLDCLDSNGCQSLSPALGTCAWNKCRQHLQSLTLFDDGSEFLSISNVYSIIVPYNVGIIPENYKCDAFMTSGVPKYRGWEEIESGASSIAHVSLFTFAGVLVALLM